ncbi:MAG: hypothetical protein WKF84_27520 [Pyrinomonadaceae bacterium]
MLYVNRFRQTLRRRRGRSAVNPQPGTTRAAPVWPADGDAQTSGEADQADEFWPEIIDV